MSDQLTFYGIGNYLKAGGKLGTKVVFLFAPDKKAAIELLMKVVGSEGEILAGSLKIVSGTTILPAWLLAAAMESREVDWSSGLNLPSITAQLTPAKEEYLN